MPQGKGFFLPEGKPMHSKEQLKRWSEMLAQRYAMGQSSTETNKEISKEYIKDNYGS